MCWECVLLMIGTAALYSDRAMLCLSHALAHEVALDASCCHRVVVGLAAW
jgi:hypothetical protein